jgi:hypothetical protein
MHKQATTNDMYSSLVITAISLRDQSNSPIALFSPASGTAA